MSQRCECPITGELEPLIWDFYHPVKELPFVNHAPGECCCKNDLKLYKSEAGIQIWLCSNCWTGEEEVKEVSEYRLTPQDLIEILRHPSTSMIRRWQCQPTHEEAFRDLAEQLQGVVNAWKEENILRLNVLDYYQRLAEVTEAAEQLSTQATFSQEVLESQRQHLMNVEEPEDYIYIPPHEDQGS